MFPKRVKPLGRGKFQPHERRVAPVKINALKKARGKLQVLIGTLGKEEKAVLNVALKQAGVRRSISQLVTDSLYMTENAKRAQSGQGPKHNISALDEGFRTVEINTAIRVIKQLKKGK